MVSRVRCLVVCSTWEAHLCLCSLCAVFSTWWGGLDGGWCGLVRCITVLHFSLGSLVALPAPGDFYGFFSGLLFLERFAFPDELG